MLNPQQSRFLDACRVGHLATVDSGGQPHVVPVCFVREQRRVYISIDEKPKRLRARPLQRLRNIMANPRVALVVDRYDEDWQRLAWVMVRGQAGILAKGAEHDRAQVLLQHRYPQYRKMNLKPLPVIAIEIEKVTAWWAQPASP